MIDDGRDSTVLKMIDFIDSFRYSLEVKAHVHGETHRFLAIVGNLSAYLAKNRENKSLNFVPQNLIGG